jgi:hypothetical protein
VLLCALLFTSLGTSAFSALRAKDLAHGLTFAERACMAAASLLRKLEERRESAKSQALRPNRFKALRLR